MATVPKKTAPTKVMRCSTRLRYSSVRLPGRKPGIKPPHHIGHDPEGIKGELAYVPFEKRFEVLLWNEDIHDHIGPPLQLEYMSKPLAHADEICGPQ